MKDVSDERRDSEANRLRALLENSSDLIGAIAGGAVGLVGGPAGSMGGAAAGVVITKTIRRVGVEVYDRLVVSRQRERVGAVLAVALDDANHRAHSGEAIRDDGFFDFAEGRRSEAEELLEGVLLQAANAYEERKLRHLGAILPSLAVRPDISPADGHWLARLADRLTWRQFVVLSIFSEPPEDKLARRDLDQEETGKSSLQTGLGEEAQELGSIGLLGEAIDDGEVVRAGTTIRGAEGLTGVPMALWRLTGPGRLLVEVARLETIPESNRADVLADLLA
jgi:hypothetical protein